MRSLSPYETKLLEYIRKTGGVRCENLPQGDCWKLRTGRRVRSYPCAWLVAHGFLDLRHDGGDYQQYDLRSWPVLDPMRELGAPRLLTQAGAGDVEG
jgi:hypothetical protein